MLRKSKTLSFRRLQSGAWSNSEATVLYAATLCALPQLTPLQVGGLRVALFNATPTEAADELASFIKEFDHQ